MRFHAPYLEWAKSRPAAAFDLAGSNVLACSLDDLPGAREALALSGRNDNGYPPLLEAIADRYGVHAGQVTTATGAAGANFQAFAALLSPGDDVLVERPGLRPAARRAAAAGREHRPLRSPVRGRLRARSRCGARGDDAADAPDRGHDAAQSVRGAGRRRRDGRGRADRGGSRRARPGGRGLP